ncbi:MAG TPA: hypothetical protein DCX54_12255 [Flavobacteriales bacterium]|nr:hypothetical protein [Flavobacteriales bacterium]
MYRKIDDFLSDWENEALFTIKIFSNISEEVKGLKPTENLRTLERMAWHITQSLTEMLFRTGIIESDLLENEPIPGSMVEIRNIYRENSDALLSLIPAHWKDEDLTERIDVYGQQWERRKILSVLVKHQAHHRGQMTALMRLNGLVVPGTYGPSKEEWGKFGMKAHE